MSSQGFVIASIKEERLHVSELSKQGGSRQEIGRFFPGQLLTAFTAWDPAVWPQQIAAWESGRSTRETRAELRLYPYAMRRLVLDERRHAAEDPHGTPAAPETVNDKGDASASAAEDALVARYRTLQYDYLRWLSWLVDTDGSAPDPQALPAHLNHYFARSLRCSFDRHSDAGRTEMEPYFQLETLKDLLYLDSLTLWTRRRRLKRCRLCGKFFVNLPKRHFAYCPWPNASGVSCRVNGPHRRYRKKIKEDPVLLEYRKMYKRGYARQERYLDRTRSSAQSVSELPSFQEWTQSAQELRRRYLRREISRGGCLEQLAALEEAHKKRMSADTESAEHPDHR